MTTKDYLANYYQNYDEDGRLLSKHGMVEYITTMKYIEKYLQPGMRIMEIGAATGRYSHALARKGYPVDAVELLEHNVDIFKKILVKESSLPSRKATQWICQLLRMIPTISPCCSAQCIICSPLRINIKHCPKQFGSQRKAALFSPLTVWAMLPSVDKRQQAGWGEKGRLTAFSFSACASKPSNCGLAGRPFSSPFRSLESLPEANRVPAKADDDALLSVRRGG